MREHQVDTAEVYGLYNEEGDRRKYDRRNSGWQRITYLMILSTQGFGEITGLQSLLKAKRDRKM